MESLDTGEDNYDVTFHVSENETCESSNDFFTRFSTDEASKLSQGMCKPLLTGVEISHDLMSVRDRLGEIGELKV